MTLSNNVLYPLAVVGFVVAVGYVLILLYCVLDKARDWVHIQRWEHTYKHRFDKPPTAACYCKDCMYHGKRNKDGCNPCNFPGVSRWTPDNGFCYEADPITAKEAEQRETD